MSRAATEWVWDHATARGTARIVLLAIADRANGDAVAYAGTAMLVQRTRAARSTVRDAVDALLDSGELVVVEGATGPRGETVYRLPLVAEHALSEGAGIRSGPESGPGRKSAPRGPESGTEGGRNPVPGGPESSPQNKKNKREQEKQQPRASSAARSPLIPELHPLGDALAAAGVSVRWSLGLGEQRDVWRLVQQHSVEALVELAARRTQPGTDPKPGRYWLKVWGDLDRSPAVRPGPNVVPFRSSSPAAYTDNLAAGLQLLRAQKESSQ
ncbi:hypothetical protein GCM10010329_17170 [Streptomyces spiroverticillatus]|uniref:Helix-turn-helix domain-containing protein n=1 Tax=Streptomyces finlayi TaxID=67296 RepID=A0A919C8D0_9ACTN|nr:hypothetical protein [Streptomyces finlayi]GGZ96524.1 hypothetical protein GCM10010329_17170 [Streptomyces spiroverticillatus]GHC81884.1 hypothetical protein GCM10010334_09650 [Streptomyces finlayi]